MDLITGAAAAKKKPAMQRVAYKKAPAALNAQQESSAFSAVYVEGDSIPVGWEPMG
ncbi:MAG: hypothetical protein HYW28_02235 [Rhodospirillales bacterium]|nr:hypothetical protein [Rhodospirillales bacterium]